MQSSPLSPNFSTSSQYLVNSKNSIDDVARGKQGGSILTNTSTWTPNAVGVSDKAQTPDHLPDLLGNEDNNPVYTTETDLQGTWDGIQPTASDFEANQLNFGAMQKSDSQGSLEFRQSVSMGLKRGETPAPLVPGVRRLSDTPSYTNGDVAIKIGMTKRDNQGNELFSVDHTQQFLENGDRATETAATYHASPDLQFNGAYATAKDSNTTTLGFNYSHTEKGPDDPSTTESGPTPAVESPQTPTAGEKADPPAPKTLSVSGQIQQNRTLDANKQSLTAGVSYGDTSVNYGHERIDPTQLTQGLALPQTQQSVSANTKLGKDITVGVNQTETIASFLDCDSNGNPTVGQNTTTNTGASLDYQISKATTLGYVHSREILTCSSRTRGVTSSPSNQLLQSGFQNKNLSFF